MEQGRKLSDAAKPQMEKTKGVPMIQSSAIQVILDDGGEARRYTKEYNQQQAEGYGTTFHGRTSRPSYEHATGTLLSLESQRVYSTRPMDGIMGGPVGPADNIQQTPEPRMLMNQIPRPEPRMLMDKIQRPDMRQMRQSLGSDFTEQEAMRDMQVRQLRESLGASWITEQETHEHCYKDKARSDTTRTDKEII